MSEAASSSTSRASKRTRTSQPLSSGYRAEGEPRSKSMHDVLPAGGLTESEAYNAYQEEYRVVSASEIQDVLPERTFGDIVQNGKVTSRLGFKDIPEIAKKLFAVFPDCATEYPQLGSFLYLDGKGIVPNAAIHQLMARVCRWPESKPESKGRFKLFVLNNMVARLSPVEFSLITGLHFHDSRTRRELEKEQDLKETIFPEYHKKKQPVPITEVLKKAEYFLSRKVASSQSVSRKLKMKQKQN